MASESYTDVEHEAEAARDAASKAAEHGQKALNEALANAEKAFNDAAKRAERALRETEKVLRDNLGKWRENARTYGDTAGQSMDEAQRYVVERVKERPVTATLTGLGVGLLLGLLLANRDR